MKILKRPYLLVTVSWLPLLLFGEETATINQDRVNVRGQPSLFAEVVTQLKRGDEVKVIEEVTLEKPKAGEPKTWAKIQMPSNTPLWVFKDYVDPSNKVVKVKRLNLRAGPGENYSAVGRLQKGDEIKEIRVTEDWIEIEPPPGAFAYIATGYRKKSEASPAPPAAASPSPVEPKPVADAPPAKTLEATLAPANEAKVLAAAPAAATAPEKVEPAPAPVEEAKKPAADPAPAPVQDLAKTDTPAKSEASNPPATTAPATTVPPPLAAKPASAVPAADPSPLPAVASPAPPKATEERPLRRIVRREGIVRSTVSLQAPTYYELISPETRRTINYLHGEKGGVKIKDFRGQTVVVTGEEGIDPRWPTTPVIEIETIEPAR